MKQKASLMYLTLLVDSYPTEPLKSSSFLGFGWVWLFEIGWVWLGLISSSLSRWDAQSRVLATPTLKALAFATSQFRWRNTRRDHEWIFTVFIRYRSCDCSRPVYVRFKDLTTPGFLFSLFFKILDVGVDCGCTTGNVHDGDFNVKK